MWPLFAALKEHADVVLASGAVLGGGWRYVFMPARGAWRARKARIEKHRRQNDANAAFLAQATGDLGEIKEQLFTNGGGSLRDTLNSVSSDVREIRRTASVSNDFVRALACEVGAMIVQFDASGDLIYATEKWHEVTGLSIEQAARDSWVQGVALDDRHRVREGWEDALANARPFLDTFRFHNPRTNAVVHVRVEAYPASATGEDATAGWVAQFRVQAPQQLPAPQ